jgi:hypothetical protein
VRKIGGIGEESKHQLHRKRNPLLRLETLRHEIDGIARPRTNGRKKNSRKSTAKPCMKRSAALFRLEEDERR